MERTTRSGYATPEERQSGDWEGKQVKQIKYVINKKVEVADIMLNRRIFTQLGWKEDRQSNKSVKQQLIIRHVCCTQK